MFTLAFSARTVPFVIASVPDEPLETRIPFPRLTYWPPFWTIAVNCPFPEPRKSPMTRSFALFVTAPPSMSRTATGVPV